MYWLKKPEQNLRGRCDSFVLETHVHFPTDLNLLMDPMRKTVTLTVRLCQGHGVAGWRQRLHKYLVNSVKRPRMRLMHAARSAFNDGG